MKCTFKWPVECSGYEWGEWREADLETSYEVSHATSLSPWASNALTKPPWNPRGDQTPLLWLRALDTSLGYYEIEPLLLDTGLFRNFADLGPEPDPEAVLKFANTFGPLGFALDHKFAYAGIGERFQVWEYHINQMRFLIEIWDAVSTPQLDQSVMDKWFSTRDKEGGLIIPYQEDILTYCGLSCEFQRNDLRDIKASLAATSYVMMAVEARLRHFISIRFFATKTGQLEIAPKDLITAMWFQFGQTISERKTHRQCEVCSRYFEVAPEVARSDRRYCGGPCRNRALRRRQKKAKELRMAGQTLRQISREIGSEMEIVKKWVKGIPKGGK